MTGDQIARCNAAISAARARVTAEEAAAGVPVPFFPTQAQRTAEAMRATLTAIEEVYAANLDDSVGPTPESTVAEIERNALQLADPGFAGKLDLPSAPSLSLPSLSDVKWILIAILGIVIVLEFSNVERGARSALKGLKGIAS